MRLRSIPMPLQVVGAVVGSYVSTPRLLTRTASPAPSILTVHLLLPLPMAPLQGLCPQQRASWVGCGWTSRDSGTHICPRRLRYGSTTVTTTTPTAPTPCLSASPASPMGQRDKRETCRAPGNSGCSSAPHMHRLNATVSVPVPVPVPVPVLVLVPVPVPVPVQVPVQVSVQGAGIPPPHRTS
jgi:hypothetical protein